MKPFIISCLKFLASTLSQLSRWLKRQLAHSKVRALIPAAIALFICIALILLSIVPVEQTFEGNLVVEEFDFALSQANASDQLFLNAIRPLNRINLNGQLQFQLLGNIKRLDGSPLFSATTNSLRIELPEPDSKLILEPRQLPSQLELDQLRLQPPSRVQKFYFDPSNHELILELDAATSEPNQVKLSLGINPLKLTLENYRLPQLSDPNLPNPLELLIEPLTSQLNLPLPHAIAIYLNLPNLESVNFDEWIWGDLSVSDIHFSRTLETGSASDSLETSTILSGTVRLGEQNLDVEKNQFFLPGKPGIQSIRQILLQATEPQGIEIRFRGKASKLEVGIDPDFPVKSVQQYLLDSHLPKEAISTLIAICVAIIAYLIPWLLTENP